jgi:hypothetical protein
MRNVLDTPAAAHARGHSQAPAAHLALDISLLDQAPGGRRDGDNQLLAACARFQVAVAECQRLETIDCPWEAVDAAGIACNEALQAVAACGAPLTPEGTRARALAAVTALRQANEEWPNDRWQDRHPPLALAVRCLLDVAEPSA